MLERTGCFGRYWMYVRLGKPLTKRRTPSAIAGGSSMSGPSTELELQVLEALEFPRSVGDILFLQPDLKAAGREPVEAAMASLSSAGLVSRVEGKKLWSMTEQGVRWLSESAEWQVRCDRVSAVADGYFSVGGLVERGLVKVGDWWHDGRGVTGSVAEVESWDAASNAVSIRV